MLRSSVFAQATIPTSPINIAVKLNEFPPPFFFLYLDQQSFQNLCQADFTDSPGNNIMNAYYQKQSILQVIIKYM